MAYPKQMTCFTSLVLSPHEQMELQSYYSVRNELELIFNDLASRLVFGQDAECDAMLATDLHLLILYFKLISKEREFDISVNNPQTWDYYRDKYCVNAIKERFSCRGLNADSIESLWISWNMNPIPDELIEGIGFSQLEGTGVDYDIFDVKN